MNWLNKLGGGLKSILSSKKIDDSFWNDLEELLITTDIGVNTAQKIILTLKKQKNIAGEEDIRQALQQEIYHILQPCEKEFVIKNSPEIIIMTGVNGAGKTTTIGKIAARFPDKKIAFIAADTFRAAAVEQLETWSTRTNADFYKGASGCDAAGLCFDSLKQILQKQTELVFIDTAGRLQNKKDLMDELQKIIRVIKKVIPQAPHQTLLTIDASCGQNALEQIKVFKEAAGVDGLIMTKLDGSAKGGTLVAAADTYALPVYFIGTGEKIEDMHAFSAKDYTKKLFD